MSVATRKARSSACTGTPRLARQSISRRTIRRARLPGGGPTSGGGSEGFARLDADFVRVLEDVIDTLVAKNLINITDLPPEAQAKLFSRKSFRERSTQHSLRLFGDTVGFGNVIDDTQFGDTLG